MSFLRTLFGKKPTSKIAANHSVVCPDRSLPSVDWLRVESALDNDYELFLQLFQILEKDVVGFLADHKSSQVVTREAAHALKGSCANLGLSYLADNFRLMEEFGLSQKPVPISIFKAVEQDLIVIRQDLQSRV